MSFVIQMQKRQYEDKICGMSGKSPNLSTRNIYSKKQTKPANRNASFGLAYQQSIYLLDELSLRT